LNGINPLALKPVIIAELFPVNEFNASSRTAENSFLNREILFSIFHTRTVFFQMFLKGWKKDMSNCTI